MAPEEDYRRHARIREETSVRWRIASHGTQGDGYIRDISVSGILLELSAASAPDKGAVFVLEVASGDTDWAIPDQARLVWSKQMKMDKSRYLCGLEFIKPSDSVVAKIAQRVEAWFSRLAGAADVNILGNYFQGKK